MKILKIKYSGLSILLFGTLLFISSCTKDDTFAPGSDDRDRYLGSWICVETEQGQAPTTFTISISSYGDSDTLVVNNFNHLGGTTVTTWLVSDNSITIPSQQVTQVDISGFGFYDNKKLDLTYTADGVSITAECSK